MNDFDERVSNIVNELGALAKVLTIKEVALKVMRDLPKEWDVKTMGMHESRDLHKLEQHDLFADLKSYEFELQTRDGEPSVPQITNVLTTVKLDRPVTSDVSVENLSSVTICAQIWKIHETRSRPVPQDTLQERFK